MRLIPVVLFNAVGAAVLFCVGSVLAKKTGSRSGRIWTFFAGLVLAAPGLLFVLYYTHLLDDAAWFYCFRILQPTELLPCGIGLLAGV